MTHIERATLLVNVAARRVGSKFPGERAVRYLRQRGVDARLVCPGSAAAMRAEAARAAERGEDAVFVAGGDGTVRTVASAIAHSNTALAPIALGTVNIWAREAGIPRGVRAALDAHLGGQTARADLGSANGEAFLLMASAGWDAAVARDVPLALKRRAGDLAYVVKGLAMLGRLQGSPARWVADGQAFEEDLAVLVASNTRVYGGRVKFAPAARANDGLIDYAALCPSRRGDVVRLGVKLALGRLAGDPAVRAGRVEALELETPGLPYQLDGDYAGTSPLRVGIEREVLAVRVPAGRLPAILAK